MKKFICMFLVALTFFTFDLSAQAKKKDKDQELVTKFAVVDTSRIYEKYFSKASVVRAYEAKKTEIQNEINRLTNELRALKNQEVELKKNGQTAEAQKLKTEINQKASFLTEYAQTKQEELAQMKKNMETSDSLYSAIYDAIAKIAEKEGYSMIFNLQQADAVLWYNPRVDITNLVIEELKGKIK